MSHALNIFFLLNKETIRYLRSGLFYSSTETELLWWLRPHTHAFRFWHNTGAPSIEWIPIHFLQFYLGQSPSFLVFHQLYIFQGKVSTVIHLQLGTSVPLSVLVPQWLFLGAINPVFPSFFSQKKKNDLLIAITSLYSLRYWSY